MRRNSRAAPRVFAGFTLASALCLPAAALAAQFDFYIKLPPIEGDSGKGRSHGGEIEIHSFSWGATQASGKVSKVDAITIKQGVAEEPAGSAGKVSIQDIAAPSATSGAGKDMTLKGSKIHENAPAAVGASQTVSIGGARTESGLPTGKRQHKPFTFAKPLAAGSLTVRGKFPGCTVGARYPTLELGDRAARHTLQDVVVTRCGGSSGGAQPMEEVSFNYAKIKT